MPDTDRRLYPKALFVRSFEAAEDGSLNEGTLAALLDEFGASGLEMGSFFDIVRRCVDAQERTRSLSELRLDDMLTIVGCNDDTHDRIDGHHLEIAAARFDDLAVLVNELSTLIDKSAVASCFRDPPGRTDRPYRSRVVSPWPVICADAYDHAIRVSSSGDGLEESRASARSDLRSRTLEAIRQSRARS